MTTQQHLTISPALRTLLIVCMSAFMLIQCGGQEESAVENTNPSDETLNGIDEMLDNMAFASIAFNAPETININQSRQIQLILSLAEEVEALKESITEAGAAMGDTVRVSDRMEARLSGYQFEITAITPEVQLVSGRDQTEWRWEINPRESGAHSLHLTLTALLDYNGHTTPRAIRTFSSVITVEVTPMQRVSLFFQNNWQWLWAAILVPVGGWLWKRRQTKKDASE